MMMPVLSLCVVVNRRRRGSFMWRSRIKASLLARGAARQYRLLHSGFPTLLAGTRRQSSLFVVLFNSFHNREGRPGQYSQCLAWIVPAAIVMSQARYTIQNLLKTRAPKDSTLQRVSKGSSLFGCRSNGAINNDRL